MSDKKQGMDQVQGSESSCNEKLTQEGPKNAPDPEEVATEDTRQAAAVGKRTQEKVALKMPSVETSSHEKKDAKKEETGPIPDKSVAGEAALCTSLAESHFFDKAFQPLKVNFGDFKPSEDPKDDTLDGIDDKVKFEDN